jgi:HNH endonuclease
MNRFWDKVNKTATCWLWTADKNPNGYGQLVLKTVNGKKIRQLAHRYAWECFNGLIPARLFVCHHCDVPACVNPEHLFLGTHQDNMRDAANKGRHRNPVMSGSKHPASKLTEEDVLEIRRRTDMPTIALIKAFMSSKANISKIKTHKVWRHV